MSFWQSLLLFPNSIEFGKVTDCYEVSKKPREKRCILGPIFMEFKKIVLKIFIIIVIIFIIIIIIIIIIIFHIVSRLGFHNTGFRII